jgi:hypothetical protein
MSAHTPKPDIPAIAAGQAIPGTKYLIIPSMAVYLIIETLYH